MVRLNSKGFAISGILYTLLVVFLLVLFSVLTGLRVRKSFLEKSLEVYESMFAGTLRNECIKGEHKASVDGKYVFKLYSNSDEYVCSSYLHKGDEFEKAVFVPAICNDTDHIFSDSYSGGSDTLVLDQIYVFGEDSCEES